eukprot:368069-Ditylum_brightwellii.AAC.1
MLSQGQSTEEGVPSQGSNEMVAVSSGRNNMLSLKALKPDAKVLADSKRGRRLSKLEMLQIEKEFMIKAPTTAHFNLKPKNRLEM